MRDYPDALFAEALSEMSAIQLEEGARELLLEAAVIEEGYPA